MTGKTNPAVVTEDKLQKAVEVWVNSALPITTALGAIAFILTDALGSGSYLEFLPNTWTKALLVGHVYLITIFALLFSMISMSYLTSALGFRGVKREVPALSKAMKFAWIIVVLAGFYIGFTVALAFVFESYNEEVVANLLTVFGLLVGGGVTSAFIFLAVKEALASDWITALLTALFFCFTSLVLLNVFRDAQKEALVGDAEYCHWVSTKEGADQKDPTCLGLATKGVDYLSYRVKEN